MKVKTSVRPELKKNRFLLHQQKDDVGQRPLHPELRAVMCVLPELRAVMCVLPEERTVMSVFPEVRVTTNVLLESRAVTSVPAE